MAAPAEDDELLPVGTMVSGKYRIERKIGSGGMGSVYAALDEALSRPVALKVIARRHTNDARLVERFRREARMASQARHPNIVEVLDLGQYDGRWYLAMELLEGLDLHEAIVLKKNYDPTEVLPVIDPILAALEHAHGLGLVHRDLKPENIFLARLPSGDIQVKLLDFGVVKVPETGAQTQLTRTGTVVGTPEYMAPEQATDSPVDARADLYAVGCVVYAMLCGRPPFQDKSVLRVLTAHVTETPRRPSEMRANMPQGRKVDPVVLKALEKSPARRYQTAAEMRAALAQLSSALGDPGYISQRLTLPIAMDTLSMTQRSPPPLHRAATEDELAKTIAPPDALRKRPPATPMVTPLPPVQAQPPPPRGVSTLGIVLAAVIGALLAAVSVYFLMRK
jgi:serine/threonine-protein kinase